jgi:hypothetical protein
MSDFIVVAGTAIICATLVTLFYRWTRACAKELFMMNLGERMRDLYFDTGAETAIDFSFQRSHGANTRAIEVRAKRYWSELGGKGVLNFQDDRITIVGL